MKKRKKLLGRWKVVACDNGCGNLTTNPKLYNGLKLCPECFHGDAHRFVQKQFRTDCGLGY